MSVKNLLRNAAIGLTAVAAAIGVVTSGASAQAAVGGRTAAVRSDTARPMTSWIVENSPGTWYRSPSAADSSGVGLANGSSVSFVCYYYGAAAGPYGNTLWYLAYNSSGTGYINDHYLNTPGTAASPQPQAGHCQTTASAQALFTAENSPGTWSNSPNASDNSGVGITNGQAIYLDCYFYGAAAGTYGNTLWYRAEGSTGSGGFINDHYLNTPGTAASPQPQTQHC